MQKKIYMLAKQIHRVRYIFLSPNDNVRYFKLLVPIADTRSVCLTGSKFTKTYVESVLTLFCTWRLKKYYAIVQYIFVFHQSSYFIRRQNVVGTLNKPKGMAVHQNKPSRMRNAVFASHVSAIGTCQYPLLRSKHEMYI